MADGFGASALTSGEAAERRRAALALRQKRRDEEAAEAESTGSAIGTIAGGILGSIVPGIGTLAGAGVGRALGGGVGSIAGGDSGRAAVLLPGALNIPFIRPQAPDAPAGAEPEAATGFDLLADLLDDI